MIGAKFGAAGVLGGCHHQQAPTEANQNRCNAYTDNATNHME